MTYDESQFKIKNAKPMLEMKTRIAQAKLYFASKQVAATKRS